MAIISVYNLTTPDSRFSAFEIECWNSGHSTRLAVQSAAGKFNSTTGKWEQSEPVFFRNLTLGTTYEYRTRVLPTSGTPSVWSSDIVGIGWQTEVAGDTTAPSAAYGSAVVTAIHNGATITLNPTGASTDIARYDIYQSLSSSTPASTVTPTSKNLAGNFTLAKLGAGTHYLWARAVDTSGNQQVWQSLANYTPLTDAQVITSAGVAASIAGQGALATKSSVDLATGEVTNKILDNVQDGTYLRTPNYSGANNMVENSNFEASAVLPPVGWHAEGGGATLTWSASVRGLRSLQVSGGQYASAVSNRHYAVRAGQTYRFSAYMAASADCSAALELWCAKADGSYADWVGINLPASQCDGAFHLVTGEGTITSPDAVWGTIQCALNKVGGGTATFDDLMCTRVMETDDLLDGSVIGEKVTLTATARDVSGNLQSVITGNAFDALTTNSGSYKYNWVGGSSPNIPFLINGNEINVCKASGTSQTETHVWTSVAAPKVITGSAYCAQVTIRKVGSDPTPNGNFTLDVIGYRTNSAGAFVYVGSPLASTVVTGSQITSSNLLVTLKFTATYLGCSYLAIRYRNTSTNADVLMSSAMTNRGVEISAYTEQVGPDQVKPSCEGLVWLNDAFTETDNTDIRDHTPTISGMNWLQSSSSGYSFTYGGSIVAGTGTCTYKTIGGKLTFVPTALTAGVARAVTYNAKNLRPYGYGVTLQADLTVVGAGTTNYIGVLCTTGDTFNGSMLVKMDGNYLISVVSGVGTSSSYTETVIGTYQHNSASATISVTNTGGSKRVSVNGTERIVCTNNNLHGTADFSNNYAADIIAVSDATGNRSTVDNLTVTLVKDTAVGVSTPPPTPPPPPPVGSDGGGGGDPDPTTGCCIGSTLIQTRAGEQTLLTLWERFTTGQWTEADDLHTYNPANGQWSYAKPALIEQRTVQQHYRIVLENGMVNDCSASHGLFHNPQGSFSRIPALTVSTPIVTVTGLSWIASIERIDAPVDIYFLEIPPTCSYVANGILAHNYIKQLIAAQ